MKDTSFSDYIKKCRGLFTYKLDDYGTSFRVLRPASLTDQIFIKAKRIRTIEISGNNVIGESIITELFGIFNYAIIGLIQLENSFSDDADMSVADAIALYDKNVEKCTSLMTKKNTDYDNAWLSMRKESITDLIIQKIARIKSIESKQSELKVSEYIDANYIDIANYALFNMIKYGD